MPTLVFTFPGVVVCPKCGYPMEQVEFDREARISIIECRTNGTFDGKKCENVNKRLIFRPIEKMLEDA
jgi:ribosomal protein L34E